MTLADIPSTPYVIPYYIGGPLDGGCGALEPTHGVMPSIRRAGGLYLLSGFQPPEDWVSDVTIAMVTPDRAVYRWEAGK